MKDTSDERSQAELIDSTPPRKLFPGEDRDAFQTFRLALLEELAAVRFHERQLAENLVDLEWEAVRYRNLRADLVRAEVRDSSAEAIEKSVNPYSLETSRESMAVANELLGPERFEQDAATTALVKTGTNLEEHVARAYAKEITALIHIERQLADIETRRRRLLDDFERLKNRRSEGIPDAEIIETDGG